MQFSDPQQERIFLDALVSYADSCVQPVLTPSCPYYRVENGSPECGEECRGVLEGLGLKDRPVVSSEVDGIVMTGRSLPLSVVVGADPFDATGLFLQDRHRPVRQQSTAALLLGLRSELFRNILNPADRPSAALDMWGELTRRGLDMDRVFSGGIAPSLAASVAARAVIEVLAADGLVDATDILGVREDGNSTSWEAVVAGTIGSAPADPHVWRDGQLGPLLSVLGSQSSFLERRANLESILQRPDIQYIMSLSFTRRVIEWYVGLASHDLEAALRGDLPTPDLFGALPGRETRQIGGLWLWERFTITETESWTASSLLQEWQWSRGGTSDICDRRVLSERHIAADTVAEAAMTSFAAEDKSSVAVEMFKPRNYVQAASNYLALGDWDKAAKIFQGIVELRPGDGEAWNNLGFCQLGDSASTALPMLRRGAALQRPVSLISIANQVLALHLLGQDAEAAILADDGLSDPHDGDVSATVWLHPVDEGELELGHVTSPFKYLQGLRAHIGERNCNSRGNDGLLPAAGK